MCIIDLSLLHLKRAPEHQGTGDFMRFECVKLVLVSFIYIYTLSALVLSSYIDVVHVLRKALARCELVLNLVAKC